jgi:hypothetical protein
MITSVWYSTDDHRPSVEGYYLAYKLPTLGDDEEGYGVYYWDEFYRDWRESSSPQSHGVRVSLWSELPPHDPRDNTVHPPSVAEIDAWNNVMNAIDKFNMVKELSR